MKRPVTLTVNGARTTVEVEPRALLVHVLRDELNLTGTHIGCDTSQCGACTVIIDGYSVKSCTVLAVQAEGQPITTIEGMGSVDALHPLQQAFWEKHGLQCGFCTPGMIMLLDCLLREDPNPDEATLRSWLSSNICRCTGYQPIMDAALLAAGRRQGQDDADVRA